VERRRKLIVSMEDYRRGVERRREVMDDYCRDLKRRIKVIEDNRKDVKRKIKVIEDKLWKIIIKL